MRMRRAALITTETDEHDQKLEVKRGRKKKRIKQHAIHSFSFREEKNKNYTQRKRERRLIRPPYASSSGKSIGKFMDGTLSAEIAFEGP